LSIQGSGDVRQSIISQLNTHFKGDPSKFRSSDPRPWQVHFKDEQAIDAGGPARELLTETAASIFHRTSLLFVLAPDERHFIPTGGTRDEFFGVGVFIGMIIRCGMPQDMPFAPLVWKYLAGDRLTSPDLTEVDPDLGRCFANPTNWIVRMWDGTTRKVPGHFDGQVTREERSLYVAKCTQMRIDAIRPSLKLMRRGFRANLGLKRDPLLRWALLARLVQGNPTLSVEEMCQICEVVIGDFPGGPANEHVQRFWRVVARFTDEQRILLLRFMTGTTRIPYTSGAQPFKLKLAGHPSGRTETALPNAATCFNKLYLPMYPSDEIAYQKILYAVQNCQTMEER
jgi:hypothetical protein